MALNVLTKILQTFHTTKDDLSYSITFKVVSQFGKVAGVKIESVFKPFDLVTCWGVISSGNF